MGRLIGALLALAGYVCIGSFLAAMLVFTWWRTTGYIDDVKLARMAAVMRGLDPASPGAAITHATPGEQVAEEQLSLDQIARARAMRSLDLELREQALRNHVTRLRTEQIKLEDEEARYKQLKSSFEAQLAALRDEVDNTNAETVRLIVSTIPTKQAKDQLVRMIDADQLDNVVALLAKMQSTRRAKIIKEFKTEDEAAKLATILERIRTGVPQTELIDDIQAQLDAATAPGPTSPP